MFMRGSRPSHLSLAAGFLALSYLLVPSWAAAAGAESALFGRFARSFFTTHPQGKAIVDEFLGVRGLLRSNATENFQLFARELDAGQSLEARALREQLSNRLDLADEAFEARLAAARATGPAEGAVLERRALEEVAGRAFPNAVGMEPGSAGKGPLSSLKRRFLRESEGGLADELPLPLAAERLPEADERGFKRLLEQGFGKSDAEKCLKTMSPELQSRFRQQTWVQDLVRTEAFTTGGYVLTHGVKDIDDVADLGVELAINAFTSVAGTRFMTKGPPRDPLRVYWWRAARFGQTVRVPIDATVYAIKHRSDPELASDLFDREVFNSAWGVVTPAISASVYRYYLGLWCVTQGAPWVARRQAIVRTSANVGTTLLYFTLRRAMTDQ